MVDDATPSGSHDTQVAGMAATWPVQLTPGEKAPRPPPRAHPASSVSGGSILG